MVQFAIYEAESTNKSQNLAIICGYLWPLAIVYKARQIGGCGGPTVPASQVVVIGDTPLDVAVAVLPHGDFGAR